MAAIIKLLDIVIKTMFVIAIGSFVVGLALGAILIWADSSRTKASDECNLRRMDHHIDELSTGSYHNTCMSAAGYKLISTCGFSLYLAPSSQCYRSKMIFWK
ncbi:MULTISPECIES: hypothetical protein [unclassified Rhizobium]|uniref:hypothetical protein n=1 Tax=unclassified Rhizobium TaxID=2613769 RepID=UPI001ADCDB53|nr:MULTISPECIES: hypothetical protein [unclassified Rhizobium]MBO9099471.1 hypothetical protein [Rhizobium sp. L58/93]QXZ87046.1 hypothetical protein J5287_20875 [Rhizobium sp. K1/93]QXZ92920.1 hypothetical protein J5280_20020 [Rhizobium sp. K15/93]